MIVSKIRPKIVSKNSFKKIVSNTVCRVLNTYHLTFSFTTLTHGEMSLSSGCSSVKRYDLLRARMSPECVSVLVRPRARYLSAFAEYPMYTVMEECVLDNDHMFLLEDSDQRTVEEALGSAGRLQFKRKSSIKVRIFNVSFFSLAY